MKSTNYHNAFITISPDTKDLQGTVPEKTGTVAAVQHSLISGAPYVLTSDDVLFQTFALRKGLDKAEWTSARKEFFIKPQACLRTSPLVKQFGWGIHHDSEGRVAIYGMDSERYKELLV